MEWRITVGSVTTTSRFVSVYDSIRSLVIDHTAGNGTCPGCTVIRLDVTANPQQSNFVVAYTVRGPIAETHRFAQLISMILSDHRISVWSIVDRAHHARLAQYHSGVLTVETEIPGILTERVPKEEQGIVLTFDHAQIVERSAQSALLSLLHD